jgi:tetratricopeptide (TPR) repeat protein
VLFWQGRLREAEEYLNQALYEGQDDALFSQGSALDRLGYALLEQGRYEEATQAFTTSIEIDPDRGHPYSGQAEAYLHRSEEPERALKLVRWGLQHRRGTLLKRLLGRREVGEIWANEAWAHTLMGHYPQADESLYQALKEADPWFKPGIAAIHYRAGLILLLRDRRQDAAEHFSQAQQTDPNGLYGRLAGRALSEMGSWTGRG